MRALPPDTPAAARIELLALLNDVPEQFRPALDGTFKTNSAAAGADPVAQPAKAIEIGGDA